MSESSLSDGQRKSLIAAALDVRKSAYAPYSGFQVGAALLCADGQIVRGCNVENAAYGMSMCAERAAVCCAIGADRRSFVALAVAASPIAPPCGACRQFLFEFDPRLTIISVDATTGEQREWILADLLPDAFRLKE